MELYGAIQSVQSKREHATSDSTAVVHLVIVERAAEGFYLHQSLTLLQNFITDYCKKATHIVIFRNEVISLVMS
jgi:hypothetical protein